MMTYYLVVCPMNILVPANLFPDPALFATEAEANHIVEMLKETNVVAVVVPVRLGHVHGLGASR